MSVNYECKKVETLKQHIKQNTIVVVKLGAKWCSPCKIIAPKFVETGDNVHRHLRKFHEEGMENLPTCSFISIMLTTYASTRVVNGETNYNVGVFLCL